MKQALLDQADRRGVLVYQPHLVAVVIHYLAFGN